MKKTLVLVAVLLVAVGAFAQGAPETNPFTHHFPAQGKARPGGGSGSNLIYHTGGAVIPVAHVVFIFWGPTFNDPTKTDYNYAQQLIGFRNQFGSTGEYNTITQYYENLGSGNQNIQLSNLGGGTADMFDTTAPPTNVTDAAVQSEVVKYLGSHAYDASAIYEVLIPASSYSSDGNSTSCGGPSLAYCAYHGHFSSGGHDVKYAIGPYPGCSGCQTSGFTDYQNAEHFICHETREAVTDPDLNAWYDRRGNEADDKCAWSPTPFIGTGGYAYQYEWSNANGACVQTR
jgi:hypothetical protein